MQPTESSWVASAGGSCLAYCLGWSTASDRLTVIGVQRPNHLAPIWDTFEGSPQLQSSLRGWLRSPSVPPWAGGDPRNTPECTTCLSVDFLRALTWKSLKIQPLLEQSGYMNIPQPRWTGFWKSKDLIISGQDLPVRKFVQL